MNNLFDRMGFDQPPMPTHLYRANAPITSIEAAESIDVTHLEKIVLDVIKYYTREAASACYDGCISDDVRKRCKNEHGIDSYSSVTARFASLERKGLIEYTGDKQPGLSGCKQRVMIATNV